jgi:hypothetical protein
MMVLMVLIDNCVINNICYCLYVMGIDRCYDR